MIPRLLLVDDHELVRAGIARILEDTCDVCGQASDGQEAIQKVLELKPDLVLLDVSMPIMGGAAAAREIRRVAPATKIVFLSMYAPETIGKLAELGIEQEPKRTPNQPSEIPRSDSCNPK